MTAGPRSGGGVEDPDDLRGKRARPAMLLAGSMLAALLLLAGRPAAAPAKSDTDPTEVAAISKAAMAGPEASISMSAGAIEARRKKTAADLADLASRIELSESTIRSLDDELVSIAADRDKLTAALKEATQSQRRISAGLDATEERITGLDRQEAEIRVSLASRRGVLAEVLAALERMGRKPPPALLVRPRDALGAVRSAILLGAVVPKMRKEAEALVADLEKLRGVKTAIVAEKDRFVAQMKEHREEEALLETLFAEKRRLEADSRERRKAETKRAAELARKAEGLKDLIASLQAEADAAKARETARRAAEAKKIAEAEARASKANRDIADARERLALDRWRSDSEDPPTRTAEGQTGRVTGKSGEDAPTEIAGATGPQPPDAGAEPPATDLAAREPAPGETSDAGEPDAGEVASTGPEETTRVAALEDDAPDRKAYDIAALRNNTMLLEPAAAFSTLKARLSKPVLGRQIIGFGEKDDIGRPSTGLSFASRPGDVVIAPADGRVLYAGPFRSYGELLILDAGDGYHIVLAGMDRIDVSSGQFVSAGEPVALMGARRLASVQVAEFGAAEPALYVEFRKDGKPVDPTPWWTEEPSGRTRNDS